MKRNKSEGLLSIREAHAAVAFDKHDLDEVVKRHPVIYSEITQQLENAVSQRDEKEYDLKLEKARLDVKLRRKLEKATDKAVLSAIELDENIIEQTRAVMEISARVREWQGIKGVFDTRRSMLKLEVELFCANHYSSDSIEGMRSTKADVVRDQANKKRKSYRKDEDEEE